MSTLNLKARSALAASVACGAFAFASVGCGFGNSGGIGASAGSSGSSAGSNGSSAGSNGNSAGSNGDTAGTSGSAGTSGGAGSGTGGATATGGTTGTAGASSIGWKNYEVTASFPKLTAAIAQKPGQLKYTKVVIQNQFLAESCSIADYNGDGVPDVSAGRIWYEGPDFKTQHPFRDGHGALPTAGASAEINTGVSDDWADYPWDMDGDGDTDIINIAQCDVPESNSPTLANNPGTPNKIGTVQVHATAVWYENPGKAGNVETITTNWTAHLMHSDVRMEQHEMVDMNGDGYP